MKYKKGDKVVIRSDLKDDDNIPKISDWRTRYKGKQTVIERISKDCYVFTIDDGDYLWTDEMIDHEATSMLGIEFDRCPSNKDQGYTEEELLKRIDDLEERIKKQEDIIEKLSNIF